VGDGHHRDVVLKSAVERAHHYEPDLNRSYSDLAAHYGAAIIPARSRKPRDKAKVEVGVQVAERWILLRPCAAAPSSVSPRRMPPFENDSNGSTTGPSESSRAVGAASFLRISQVFAT
jgi:hypothetical protein